MHIIYCQKIILSLYSFKNRNLFKLTIKLNFLFIQMPYACVIQYGFNVK